VANDPTPTRDVDQARLALRPKEAARALGIGERLLWSLTNQGQIPHLRLGRSVLYPTEQLRDFLAQQAKGATR
jgi:excisionase family DNA binding protein